MLYYWIMFEKSPIPERYIFKNHQDFVYYMDMLVIEKGNILWMIKV